MRAGLLVLGILLAALGGGILQFGAGQSRRAALVAAPPGDGAFREDLFVGPAALLTSRHSRVECVAYRTRVIMHSEWPGESSDEVVFQERRGPPELELVTSGGRAVRLPLELWTEPEVFVTETSGQAPPWLSPPPERRAPKTEFRVEEVWLKPGQPVFVAATLGPEGRLQADPNLEALVLYPGSRRDCVEHYRRAGSFQERAGRVFLALGAGLVVISGALTLNTRRKP